MKCSLFKQLTFVVLGFTLSSFSKPIDLEDKASASNDMNSMERAITTRDDVKLNERAGVPTAPPAPCVPYAGEAIIGAGARWDTNSYTSDSMTAYAIVGNTNDFQGMITIEVKDRHINLSFDETVEIGYLKPRYLMKIFYHDQVYVGPKDVTAWWIKKGKNQQCQISYPHTRGAILKVGIYQDAPPSSP